MKIAIYDSEDAFLMFMLKGLKRCQNRYKHIEEIVAFNHLDFMEKEILKGHYDLICFSIVNADQEEIRRVTYICRQLRKSYILLLGNEMDFYQKAYRMGVSQYLVKSTSMQQLVQDFNFVIEKCLDQDMIMKFYTMGGVMNIRLNDILYVETHYDRYVLHTEHGIYFGDVRFLRKVRYRLLTDHFIRVHQSYIVNVGAVSHYTKSNVTFFNGEQIPVSRRCYKQLKKEIKVLNHEVD